MIYSNIRLISNIEKIWYNYFIYKIGSKFWKIKKIWLNNNRFKLLNNIENKLVYKRLKKLKLVLRKW